MLISNALRFWQETDFFLAPFSEGSRKVGEIIIRRMGERFLDKIVQCW